jgi:ParB/RepB/Spo0J family partition protein
MAKGKEVSTGELVRLDPAVILADSNTRYGLKQSRVDSLAKSILERGEVLEPVEVEALDKQSENGHRYRLTTGFYRLAAVAALNLTGAGLTVPAIVRPIPTPQERLRRQLAENMERENQSPMDQAVAIRSLLDSGLTKMEVREIFARPGGRKGNKVQPASNSFINMTLSFLELPKGIQEKIHDGRVGVAAAYELTKVPAEKRTQVLERAEADRQKALEQEEKDEEKLLAQEKKQAEDKAKRDALLKEVTDAEGKVTAAKTLLAERTKLAERAYDLSKAKHPDAKAKKEAISSFKKAEQDRQLSEADVIAVSKEWEDLRLKFEKRESLIAEKAAKLKQARATAPAGAAAQKGEAVGSGNVKKAAAQEGVSASYVPLNASEMRKTVSELALPGGNPKVVAIGQALVRCFAGESTDKELYKELAKICG